MVQVATLGAFELQSSNLHITAKIVFVFSVFMVRPSW